MYLINLYCRLEFYILRKIWFYKFKKEWKSVILKFGLIGGSNNIEIWDYVYIWDNFNLWWEWGLKIWNNTIIWPNVKIRSTNHDFKSWDYLPYWPWIEKKEVNIWENCWIWDSVNIVPWTKIWYWSIIWMWSTIYGNIPPYSIVVNSSMSIIKNRNINEYKYLDENSKYYIKYKSKWKI